MKCRHGFKTSVWLLSILVWMLEYWIELARQVDPTKTLLYVVGGEKMISMLIIQIIRQNLSLAVLLKLLHQHGFRVMPHVNLVGVSTYHPLYAELQKFQFRDPWTGKSYGWKWEQTENPSVMPLLILQILRLENSLSNN